MMPPFAAGLLMLVVVLATTSGCGSDDDDPVLTLQKTGPTYTAPQAPVLYTLVATNNGDELSGARIVDQLPPQVDMGAIQVNFTAPWSCDSDLDSLQVTCTVDRFATGSTEIQIFAFFSEELQPGERIRNTATLSADAAASATAAWTTTVLPPTTVSVTKTGPATALAGGQIRYDLTLTNDGRVPAVAPRISEYIPEPLFPRAYSAPAGWECEFAPVGPVQYFCEGPDLARGDSVAVSITMEVASDTAVGTILTNRIVGRAKNSAGAQATATTEVIESLE